MHIEKDTEVPMYIQIAEQISQEILSGMRTSGDRLPSIRELAKELQISVVTSMKAYEELEKQGLIIPLKGKGYFVNTYDNEMVHEQHLRKIEAHLNAAILDAQAANMSGEHLCNTLRQLVKISGI